MDGRGSRVNNGREMGVGAGVQAELLCDFRDFLCRKHDAEAQQHVLRECQQAKEQQSRLQKGRQTESSHLFAPAVEAVRIAPGDGEHIQTAYGDLCQQDAAAFDICEEYFNHAVGKGNHAQKQEQARDGIGSRHKMRRQRIHAEIRKIVDR